MGASASSLEQLIKIYGQSVVNEQILIHKKMNWLKNDCKNQINKKVDDEVIYVLSQMDDFLNKNKEVIVQSYKRIKGNLLKQDPLRIKDHESKHRRALENIYGKTNIIDELSLVKVHFHIEVHLTKKKIKKSINQKFSDLQNSILYEKNDQKFSDTLIQRFESDDKLKIILEQNSPQINESFEKFKQKIIMEFDFQQLFWSQYDRKIKSTYQQVQKICKQAEIKIKQMRDDFIANWGIAHLK